MRIAYLGDIVGTVGRQALTQQLPTLREEHGVDRVIVNAENTAGGSGLTPDQVRKLLDAGVDGLTLGDHAFRKQQIRATLEAGDAPLIRPMNLPGRAWGRGWMTIPSAGGPPLLVCMLMGRLFMNSLQADDPFAALDRLLESPAAQGAIVLVEIHAEATSEKVAFGWHANGRVAAVVGSHTHVPTADARLLPGPGSHESIPSSARLLPAADDPRFKGGTAYVTDLGMTGPQDSVLGRRVDRVLHHMTTALPAAFDVAEANPVVHGVLIDVDPAARLATAIERIALPADPHKPPFTL